MSIISINNFVKKVIAFLIYGPGYKAPEYEYVRVTPKFSDREIYEYTLRR